MTIDAIILNKEKNQMLLVKRALHMKNNPGKWALPGGYLNRDERITDGVLREMFEETGYEGKIVNLFRIIDDPNRAQEDTQNVDFVFLVEATSKTGKEDDESSQVKWFKFDELPKPEEFAFDHYESIELYLRYFNQPLNLPIFG